MKRLWTRARRRDGPASGEDSCGARPLKLHGFISNQNLKYGIFIFQKFADGGPAAARLAVLVSVHPDHDAGESGVPWFEILTSGLFRESGDGDAVAK